MHLSRRARNQVSLNKYSDESVFHFIFSSSALCIISIAFVLLMIKYVVHDACHAMHTSPAKTTGLFLFYVRDDKQYASTRLRLNLLLQHTTFRAKQTAK